MQNTLGQVGSVAGSLNLPPKTMLALAWWISSLALENYFFPSDFRHSYGRQQPVRLGISPLHTQEKGFGN